MKPNNPTNHLTALLQGVVYFEDLAVEDIQAIAQYAERYTYDGGASIFFEEDAADGLWLVEEGHVKIFKLSMDGREHILHILGPGNTFNDMAALDGGLNPANATALSPCTVWMIRSEILLNAMRQNSELAIKIVRILATRVRGLVGQIEDLALYSVIVRLARFLIKQAEDPALMGPGVTRTAIAAHINTTPQTITNALHSLEDAGAIAFNRHKITIVREDILRSIAEL